MTWKKGLFVTVGFLVLALAVRGEGLGKTLSAIEQALGDALEQTLQVDVDLVLVNATVTDPLNRYVTSLQQDHFEIFEDRVEQDVQYFSAEDVSLSLGIIFDISGSMKDKASVARDAAATFLRTGGPDDEYFLVAFNSSPEVLQDFTTDISRLQNHLIFAQTTGMTALYDAVYLGLEKLRDGINTKKALLMITDGEDNRSRYTFSNVREFVKESDVQIYSIGIVDAYSSQLALGRSGRANIDELSETTGGRSFFPNSVFELEDITTKIAVELKNQYVLGYFSTNEDTDGEWRDVQVRVDPPRGLPRLTVRARQGYYGPIQ
jgi:Ca-activated chloride channel family protein